VGPEKLQKNYAKARVCQFNVIATGKVVIFRDAIITYGLTHYFCIHPRVCLGSESWTW
jgi:hypothetical protein